MIRAQVKPEAQQEIASDTSSSLRIPAIEARLRNAALKEQVVRVAAQPSREVVEITTLRDGRLRLVQPLRVTITREKAAVTAQLEDIDEFGQGVSLADALEDLQRCVAELFLTLEDDEDVLGADLRRVREWLLRYVARP